MADKKIRLSLTFDQFCCVTNALESYVIATVNQGLVKEAQDVLELIRQQHGKAK